MKLNFMSGSYPFHPSSIATDTHKTRNQDAGKHLTPPSCAHQIEKFTVAVHGVSRSAPTKLGGTGEVAHLVQRMLSQNSAFLEEFVHLTNKVGQVRNRLRIKQPNIHANGV